MKKLTTLLVISVMLCLNVNAQEQRTYTYEEGSVLLYQIDNDTLYTAISINGVQISNEVNKSTWACWYEKKLWCCSHPRECPYCCENRACEIAWWTACLFDWWRQQKPKP